MVGHFNFSPKYSQASSYMYRAAVDAALTMADVPPEAPEAAIPAAIVALRLSLTTLFDHFPQCDN